MLLEGRIENGQVVMDETPSLPEGTRVRLEVVTRQETEHVAEAPRLSFVQRFQHLIGKAENLSADASMQLDHYLYGLPKRES